MTRRDCITACGSALLIAGGGVWFGSRKREPSAAPDASWRALRLQSRDGRIQVLSNLVAREGAVIYVFRVDCTWCEKNKWSVNALAHQLATRLPVIGCVIDGQWPSYETYVFPVYEIDSAAGHNRIAVTPTTVVVDGSGQVRKRIEGTFRGANRAWLAQYLNVTL